MTALAHADGRPLGSGGRAFTAPDPTALPTIFYTALSGMLCQPPLCEL